MKVARRRKKGSTTPGPNGEPPIEALMVAVVALRMMSAFAAMIMGSIGAVGIQVTIEQAREHMHTVAAWLLVQVDRLRALELERVASAAVPPPIVIETPPRRS